MARGADVEEGKTTASCSPKLFPWLSDEAANLARTTSEGLEACAGTKRRPRPGLLADHLPH